MGKYNVINIDCIKYQENRMLYFGILSYGRTKGGFSLLHPHLGCEGPHRDQAAFFLRLIIGGMAPKNGALA
jgi:hypothetical protein